MRKRTVATLMIIAIVVIALASPYIKTEYLIYKYGNEFENLYKETHMIDNVDYCKVLEHSSSYAKVLYVARDSGTYVFEFNYDEDRWQISYWEVVYSKSGSADIIERNTSSLLTNRL